MVIYQLTYQLTEGKHYHDCQDVITHPIVNEAFMFGDQNGSNYNAIEWEGSVYAAELVIYSDGTYEVFVGEWLEDSRLGK